MRPLPAVGGPYARAVSGPTLGGHARGRHHPPRGEPDPAGARGPRARRDRHAAPALRPRPLARAPRRPDGRGGRRARQEPVPALRGRPRRLLAPADDGLVGRIRDRPGLAPVAEPRMAGAARGRPRRRPVRRAGPRADDRVARAVRPAPCRARPRRPRPRVRPRAVPTPPARGRPDAPDRRRPARAAQRRRPRDDLAHRGLLRGRARPVAGDRRGERRRRDGGHRGRAPADGAQRHGGLQPSRHAHLRQAGAAVPALRRADPLARAGRQQPSDILVRGMPDVSEQRRAAKRIGHKGADLISPGNTLASFDAALAAGVDMVEFDVLPEREDGSGRLMLAHDFAAARGAALTLEEGLAHFAQDAWAGVELNVDLKLTGYERRVVDALRAHGLADRALRSTMEEHSLRELRRAAPEVRIGWSVPKIRRNPLSNRWTRIPALILAQYARVVLPGRVAREMREGRIDALMCHWALVSARLVSAIEDAGGELYVWTVDDAERIAKLQRLGVTGIITNDPRLFGAGAA